MADEEWVTVGKVEKPKPKEKPQKRKEKKADAPAARAPTKRNKSKDVAAAPVPVAVESSEDAPVAVPASSASDASKLSFRAALLTKTTAASAPVPAPATRAVAKKAAEEPAEKKEIAAPAPVPAPAAAEKSQAKQHKPKADAPKPAPAAAVTSAPVVKASKESKGVSYKDAVKKAASPTHHESAHHNAAAKPTNGVAGAGKKHADESAPAAPADDISGTLLVAGSAPLPTSPGSVDSVWAALNKSIANVNAGDAVHSASLHDSDALGASLGLASTLSAAFGVSALQPQSASQRKIVLNAAAAEFIPSYLAHATTSS